MIEVTHIRQTDTCYPDSLLCYLGEDAPCTLSAVGNLELLKTRPLALFCSRKCPGNLILQTYDLAQKLREESTAVISGFHSPVERECLNILVRGKNPIIICLARGFERMRIPKEYTKPLDQERLLLLSPFSEKYKRATKEMATARNAVVAALANSVFVAHAESRSSTETLCRNVLEWGKLVYTFENEANDNLLDLGAKPNYWTRIQSSREGVAKYAED
jgi:predicted Rossmann fold nucleotide-binding protein DprA/Smf involved in DNA uptake